MRLERILRRPRWAGLAGVLDWLMGPAILLAIPVIFLVAVLLVTFVLVFSLYTAFKLWRALNRLKKAGKKEGGVIEGEYWIRD